ncbi:PKD-like family lipoprotein [Odoribacter splanchnicus]|uniref:PKD-like family lipoprotein n=1 Tax=Odoribacter splanchnicus TaxID=28118 RepID=A0AAW5C5D1_9BACT|nr:PKD-like family lipoprotein [Odoribacter splanchnicus]MBV4398563.1 hypothetical protein [Odoribacter splanchnicus]MBV4407229.1 hypothetical protein [Odoribacter splanchnicus]MCG4960247.1 PKD-like family lipoprotein [Odoribacter splanchnicus]MCG5001228.1 PKD-like family lipoprotein [Odoribacter splanchnicus]
MKSIRLYIILFLFGLLTGCFEDEGNYSYEEINPPLWSDNFNTSSPKRMFGYAGDGEVMKFRGSKMFTWETDSAMRADEVRYEWKIKGVVISEELDFDMPTDEVVKKIGLTRYSNDVGEWGTFSVIEKKTGITFPARLFVYFYPPFAPDDWFILSENGDKSKVSVISPRTVSENGKNTVNYKLKDDVYATINGHDIPGKPKDLVMETSRDVSAGGACVILTDQVAYEVNVQNMMKVDEVKDQFLDGAPADFKIAAMREKAPSSPSFGEGSASFIVTEDGRLFTRMRSANYLVGKYLTEPYYIDAKGYEITMLGHSTYGQNIPCYDAKNRRVVMATTWREDVGEDMYNKTSVYKTRVIPLKSHVNVPVSGFAEGTEMLYLSQKNHISWGFTGTSLLFTAYYNEPGADGTIIGDFGFDNRSATFKYAGLERKLTLPVKLDASSVFLVSSNYRSSEYAEDAKYRDFYSVGNELYFVQRPDFYFDFSMRVVKFNATIPSKITSLAYAFFDLDQLWIGCEDGTIQAYDIRNINSPVLLFEKNVGGKVASIKQIGWHTTSHDWY